MIAQTFMKLSRHQNPSNNQKRKSITYYVNKYLKSYGSERVKNSFQKAALLEKYTVLSKSTKK